MADDEKEHGPWEKYGSTAVAEPEHGPWEKFGQQGETSEEEPTEENLPGSTERLRSAVSSGVAKMQPPTKFEEANKMQEGGGFTPSNIASNLWRGGKEVVGATGQMAKDLLFSKGKDEQGQEQYGLGGLVGMSAKGGWDPTNRISTLASKYIVDPATAEIAKAKEELAKGHTLGAIGHAGAAAIPVLGPNAADIGEQIGTGDIGGGLARAGGQIAGGEMMAHPVETMKAPLKLADKVIRGTPLTEKGKLAAAKEQAMAVKPPSMTETEYAEKVTNAMPDLQKIAQDNKGKRFKSPREAVQGFNDRISQIESPIAEQLKELNGPNDVVHPDEYQDVIGKAIDKELAKRPGSYKPDEIEKAKKSVMEFVGDQPKRYEEFEGNRRRLNQDADDYYKSSPADKRAINVSDATAVAQRAAGNAIRDILYGDGEKAGHLENAGVTAVDQSGKQVPLRDVRKQVGNLIEIRDHFEDAITKAEKAGDWKAFDKWRSGPSVAAGGLGLVAGGAVGGPLGALFGTLAGEGVKAWADYLKSKNPNLNVEKMFRNLEATGKPNTADIQVRAPIRQYDQPIGPQVPHSMEAAGPKMPPEPFELPGIQPKPQAGLWEQQAGALPDLTWGGKNPPYFEPAGPKEAPMEEPLPPIQGTQQSLNLPPENASLFNIQQTPRVGEPPAPVAPPPEGGVLPPIGGPGREGVLGRIEPARKGEGLIVPPEATKASAQPTPPPGPRWTPDRGAMPGEPELLLDMPEGGDPSEAKAAIVQREDPRQPGRARWEVMDSKGESQGLFSTPEDAASAAEKIFPGKAIGNQEPLTTSHGVTFGGGQDLGKGLGIEHTISVGGRRVGSITVEPRDEGVLHVHWLGGEFGREMRQPIMDAIHEAYPETKKITYDRRRLARGAESATTEPREMNVKPMVPPKPAGKS